MLIAFCTEMIEAISQLRCNWAIKLGGPKNSAPYVRNFNFLVVHPKKAPFCSWLGGGAGPTTALQPFFVAPMIVKTKEVYSDGGIDSK